VKRILPILPILLFQFARVFTQDYSFFDYSARARLNSNLNYLLLKFNRNVSLPEHDRVIYELLGSSAKNKHIMYESHADGSRDINVIIELRGPLVLENIRRSIADRNELKFAGIAFQTTGKVLHFTNDELVVKFRDYVAAKDVERLNSALGCSLLERLDLSPVERNVCLLSINSKSDWSPETIFEKSRAYSSSPLVEYAQPNFIRTGMLLSEIGLNPGQTGMNVLTPGDPNDPMLPLMWHIRNRGNNIPDTNIYGIPGCDANVDSAWLITTGNTKVLVAILDTGVDTNHIDLRDNLCDRGLWYDAYDEDQKPYDEFYHGTGVTGVSSAIGNNGLGTVGVSYSCQIMPVRVFGPYPEAFTTDLILAKGLNWAWSHGAAVFNLSWGGGIPVPLISNAIRNAFRYGRNGRGTVIFAGSGNDNIDMVLYPSSMEEVISVGGLSPCNQRKSLQSCDNYNNNNAWGASYGEGLSVVAPCSFIGTTHLSGGWGYDGNGTSVSSPIGAGVGALILTKNINLSADSVMIIIERSAVKVGNYSYNVPRRNGLWNYEMGYGRLDAKRALDMTPPGPSQIYDQSPPVIAMAPPESGVLSGQIILNASISDNELVAPPPNSPRLYFFTSDNSTIQTIIGTAGQDSNYSFPFPDLGYGTRMFYYLAAQDTSSNGNITTFPRGGSGINPPGTNRPQRMLFLQNTDYYSAVFNSTNVPIYITAAQETTVVSFLNNGVPKALLDVNCMINIEHSNLPDLSVSLISPSGTEVVLVAGINIYHDMPSSYRARGLAHLSPGTYRASGLAPLPPGNYRARGLAPLSPGNYRARGLAPLSVNSSDEDNFTNTIFDDEAAVSITDTNYGPPYTGRFRPIEPLWWFDGENSAGEWKLKIVDNGIGEGGTLLAWNMEVRYSSINENVSVPGKFALVKNYPNPFNPGTRIVFDVAYPSVIKIVIYDILGRQIATLLEERRSAKASDFVDFDSRSNSINGGRGLPSGVYFYALFADGNFIDSKRMVLLK
jgi:subtilisin-like proprotein convertase family protein